MNANIPTLHVFIPRAFLTNGRECRGAEEAYAFAISSTKGRALHFHVMLKSGAHFRGIPLHALHSKPPRRGRPSFSLPDLQLWDCFSWHPVVTVFDYLLDHQCTAVLKGRQRINGAYRFTVDWLPDSQETPGLTLQPEQNKCAHLIELENGQFAALPTNRILWKDAYFIGNNPAPEKAGYVAADTVWRAETCERWSVAEDENAFYGMEDRS